ncbi:MAG: type II toxin-antitoxin system VapC family toxin [Planctomycetes bacterium]|nr:type II toxin-antitoxin system VapC family toxin [Planctomycetota bacterium]
MAYLIADTDVLIDYFCGARPAATIISNHLESGTLAITSITRFELLSGLQDSARLGRMFEFLDVVHTFPLDSAAADRAAEVRRDLESRGEKIGTADSLIAGIVLSQRLRLFTRNLKHYKRVLGLELEET